METQWIRKCYTKGRNSVFCKFKFIIYFISSAVREIIEAEQRKKCRLHFFSLFRQHRLCQATLYPVKFTLVLCWRTNLSTSFMFFYGTGDFYFDEVTCLMGFIRATYYEGFGIRTTKIHRCIQTIFKIMILNIIIILVPTSGSPVGSKLRT